MPERARGTTYYGYFSAIDWMPTLVSGFHGRSVTRAIVYTPAQWVAVLSSGQSARKKLCRLLPARPDALPPDLDGII